MSVVMIIVGAGDGRPTPHAGRYLAHYDPDAEPLNGVIVSTADKAEALRFADVVEGLECRNQISKTMPQRLSDGKPNRPLSAYTVTFQTVE